MTKSTLPGMATAWPTPRCRKCNDRGYYLENFADNHFTPCSCERGKQMAGARPVT